MAKIKREIKDLWNEMEAIKKAARTHIASTKVLRKKVQKLEADIEQLKKKPKARSQKVTVRSKAHR